MNSQTTKRTAHQPRSDTGATAKCCAELQCESGLRNNYFEGKRLTAESFRVEQRYMLERRRLLNRAIHGWGVVYGYEITPVSLDPCKEPGSGRLKIGAGLALDPCGRELLQAETCIGFGDVILLDENGARADRESALSYTSPQQCWLLSAHYAEQYTDAVPIQDPCHCEHHEWDRVCETVRYSLRPIPCGKCCDDFDCELDCDCRIGPCCDESVASDPSNTEAKAPRKRGGCRCLCEHITQWAPENKCGRLCEIEEVCARVDLQHGVPLACVELSWDDCNRRIFGTGVEACGPRRLVKRNDLLFDLIRGCDLTRISRIGWEAWHRNEDPISFEKFPLALGWNKGEHDKPEYVTRDFWVEFSRPVRWETLRPDCFAMTVLIEEGEGGWWETFRVPIDRLEATDIHDAVYVRKAWIVVNGSWLEDAVTGPKTKFKLGRTRVELEIRGDFILDCNGQAVDANALGLSKSPTGNGTPGGTFVSTFRLERDESNDSSYRRKGVSS